MHSSLIIILFNLFLMYFSYRVFPSLIYFCCIIKFSSSLFCHHLFVYFLPDSKAQKQYILINFFHCANLLFTFLVPYRQRRRERLESKENDPRSGLEPGEKDAKIRKSHTQPKDNGRGRISSKADDLILKEILSDEEDVKQTRCPKASPRGRVVMVMPKEDESVSSRQRADEDEDEVMQVGSDNKVCLILCFSGVFMHLCRKGCGNLSTTKKRLAKDFSVI